MSEMEENFIHNRYGYCYFEVEEGKVPIIFNLYVHPEYRRTGKAKELLSYVICKIRSLGYTGDIDIESLPREQSISSESLSEFYRSLGLHVIECSPVNELSAEIERLQTALKSKEIIIKGRDEQINRLAKLAKEKIESDGDYDNRPFPIQGNYFDKTTQTRNWPCSIPWWLAEEAYKYYSSKFGNTQTLERLAERGGFGRKELLMFLRREEI